MKKNKMINAATCDARNVSEERTIYVPDAGERVPVPSL